MIFAENTSRRRVKLLKVPCELFINWALCLQRPRLTDDGMLEVFRVTADSEGKIPPPDGMKVEAVRWDEMYRCFWLRVSHDSFDEVPDCQPVPEMELWFRIEKIKASDEAKVAFRQWF